MLREWGLTSLLASVGLGAGHQFFNAFIDGIGWLYMGIGYLIAMLPMLAMALLARIRFKINFHSIAGLIAGTATR